MVTISRLTVRNIRAIGAVELVLPLRGRILIGAVYEGKTSMVLAMRLALQGLASGLAVDDLIAYGSRTGQVELELCDGQNVLQIKRQISSSGENVRVNLRQGLAQASADNPAAGQELIGRMFAYPVDQVCEFFMWSSASAQSCDCLAADRTYLRRVLDRLDGDAEIEQAIGKARSAVALAHDSRQHRELATRRLRLRRQLASQSLAGLAPQLRAARDELQVAESELEQAESQLSKESTTTRLGGRDGEIFAAACELVDLAQALDDACAQLRILHDLATDADGGEAELIRLRAKAGRLKSARDAMAEAFAKDVEIAGGESAANQVGAMLSDLVDLRTFENGGAEIYARWIDLSERASVSTRVSGMSRFDLADESSPAADGPIGQLQRLEQEMLGQGLRIPNSPDEARELLNRDAGELIEHIEQELRRTGERPARDQSRRLRAEGDSALERAHTILFGLNIPTNSEAVEQAIHAVLEEIENLERLAEDPEALAIRTHALETDIVRIRQILDKRRSRLCELEPNAGLDGYELVLDRVEALRDSACRSEGAPDGAATAPDPVLDRKVLRARQRREQARRKLSDLESEATVAAREIDMELQAALYEAAGQPHDRELHRRLQLDIRRLDSQIAKLDAEIENASAIDRRPAYQVDANEAQNKLDQLQGRRRRRRKLAAAVRAMDQKLGDRAVAQTLQNARNLLPRLSAGKYFDLRVEADCSLRLWDEAAQDWISSGQFGSGLTHQSELLLWLARAVTHSGNSVPGLPGFCILDEPGAVTSEQLRGVLGGALVEDGLLAAIPQMLVLSGNPTFERCGFKRLAQLDG